MNSNNYNYNTNADLRVCTLSYIDSTETLMVTLRIYDPSDRTTETNPLTIASWGNSFKLYQVAEDLYKIRIFQNSLLVGCFDFHLLSDHRSSPTSAGTLDVYKEDPFNLVCPPSLETPFCTFPASALTK